jgi:SAM-dependent methyltransferase
MNEKKVISDFGDEWERFNFSDLQTLKSLEEQFEKYLAPLPKDFLARYSLVIADFGAGTGRWSYFLQKYAAKLFIVEPSQKAFEVAKAKLGNHQNVILLNQTIESSEIKNESLDLAVSLGVLHHIVDTKKALNSIADRIKPGGLFLGYLYYALDNKPSWYRILWRLSDLARKLIAHSPRLIKTIIAELIALFVYLPLSRFSRFLGKLGISTANFPLHHYEELSFYVMRNDSLDRFGTSLEKRFTKIEIEEMLKVAGFHSLKFSDEEPFWTFSAIKNS